jgi:hypothetical protein
MMVSAVFFSSSREKAGKYHDLPFTSPISLKSYQILFHLPIHNSRLYVYTRSLDTESLVKHAVNLMQAYECAIYEPRPVPQKTMVTKFYPH